MELLQVKNLRFSYAQAEKSALNAVSFSMQAGEFVVLCGLSGSGKTTLLRLLKPARTPNGKQAGEIVFNGENLQTLDPRRAAAEIGYVGQDPRAQIVTDRVWHELAFGAESLGWEPAVIRRRAAEIASFFGIEPWFRKKTAELSGGQAQILNLASVMMLRPKLLLLDEPTAQLDPIAASEFFALLKRIQLELGVCVLLCEQRLEEALTLCDRMAVLDGGSLLCCGSVREVGAILKETRHPCEAMLPAAMRIWNSVESELPCPISVNDGRRFLADYLANHEPLALDAPPAKDAGEPALELDEVFFRYEKNEPDVLRGLRFSAARGELVCWLGGNGAGKTTALQLLCGNLHAQRGTARTFGKTALLPQDPALLFVKSNLKEDLLSVLPKPQDEAKLLEAVRLCRLEGLLSRHPLDLSGGELQRAALAKLLLVSPEVLLLDEPTKGLDAAAKAEFAAVLHALCEKGVCVLLVSHDVDFCASNADRCALFFDGAITAEAPPRAFFSGNYFYTTSAHRIARGCLEQAVTVRDLIGAIGGSLPEQAERDQEPKAALPAPAAQKEEPARLPRWRKWGAALCALASLGVFAFAASRGILQETFQSGGVSPLGKEQLLFYGVLLFLLFGALAFAAKKQPSGGKLLRTPLPLRTKLFVFVLVLLIPATLALGLRFGGARSPAYLSLAVLLEAMLPFFLVLEGRKPSSRELVLLAALSALNVAGRAAFFMLPQFKPVLAMTVLVGVALGGESGFLVGALTMLVSNLLFSQGPWTPWQMFAMGLIGALAGLLANRGLLQKSRLSLSIFGAVCAVLVYGGIMNPAAALLWSREALSFKLILTYYLTGLPMDLIHAAASFFFLWILSDPMLETLERMKKKLIPETE